MSHDKTRLSVIFNDERLAATSTGWADRTRRLIWHHVQWGLVCRNRILWLSGQQRDLWAARLTHCKCVLAVDSSNSGRGRDCQCDIYSATWDQLRCVPQNDWLSICSLAQEGGLVSAQLSDEFRANELKINTGFQNTLTWKCFFKILFEC